MRGGISLGLVTEPSMAAALDPSWPSSDSVAALPLRKSLVRNMVRPFTQSFRAERGALEYQNLIRDRVQIDPSSVQCMVHK